MNILKRKFKEISQLDAAYMAGLFDGEGSVGIYERSVRNSGRGAVNPYIGLTMNISNTHRGALEYIKEHCGGVNGSSDKFPPRVNGLPKKRLHRWSAQSAETPHILRQILPFLIIKREQAMVALEFADLVESEKYSGHPGRIGNERLTEEQLSRRREFAKRIKNLKR